MNPGEKHNMHLTLHAGLTDSNVFGAFFVTYAGSSSSAPLRPRIT